MADDLESVVIRKIEIAQEQVQIAQREIRAVVSEMQRCAESGGNLGGLLDEWIVRLNNVAGEDL